MTGIVRVRLAAAVSSVAALEKRNRNRLRQANDAERRSATRPTFSKHPALPEITKDNPEFATAGII
jgi:hypothetical protein